MTLARGGLLGTLLGYEMHGFGGSANTHTQVPEKAVNLCEIFIDRRD